MYLKDYVDENIEITGTTSIVAILQDGRKWFGPYDHTEWLTFDEKNYPDYINNEKWNLIVPYLPKIKNRALEVERFYDSVKISELYRNDDSYYVQVMIEVNKKRSYRNIEIEMKEFNKEMYGEPTPKMPKLNRKPKREYWVHEDMIEYALLKLEKEVQSDYDYLNTLITISAEPNNLTVTLGKYCISMSYQEWVCTSDSYFQKETEGLFDPYLSKIKALAHIILNTITQTNDDVKETEMFFDKDGKLVVRPLDRIKRMKDGIKSANNRLITDTINVKNLVDSSDKTQADIKNELHASAVDYKKKHDKVVEEVYSPKKENIEKSKEWSEFTKVKEISDKLEEN